MNTNLQNENMDLLQQDGAMDEFAVEADRIPVTVNTEIAATKSTQSPDHSDQKKPVDFRYVPHGHGPCSCCGQLGE